MCNFCSNFGTPRKRVPSEVTFAPCGAYTSNRDFFEKNGLMSCFVRPERLSVNKLPIATPDAQRRDKYRYFLKKMSVYLRMCNFCSNFVRNFVLP